MQDETTTKVSSTPRTDALEARLSAQLDATPDRGLADITQTITQSFVDHARQLEGELALLQIPWAGAVESPTASIVLWFAGEMERKLAANRHKGNQEAWRKDAPDALTTRIEQELVELRDAINAVINERTGAGDVRMELLGNVIGEAADVANFALMVGDQANELLRAHAKNAEDAKGTAAETDGSTGEGKP